MDSNNDGIILQKQDLLKNEILEKNFDKELFLDFCISRKENGDDLDNWTLEELESIISEFKIATQKRKESDNIKEKKRETMEEINVEVEKIKIYVKYIFNSIQKTKNEEKYMEKEIQCKKIEKTVLNGQEIVISIRNPKAVEGSFFTSNYVTYEIVTELAKWNVRRRYSDFEWLRNMLAKFFPGHLIPPLPNKKVGSRRFEEDFVEKRMKFLQKFLNVICESEYFKSSDALVTFLSISDRVVFDSKMKEFNSYQSPSYVEDMKTFDGKIQIVDDEENEKYFNNITNYFSLQTQLLERIHYSMKSFHNNITSACMNLEEVEKDFRVLNTLNSRVLMVIILFYFLKEEVTKSYEEISVFMRNWKRIMSNQDDIYKHHIKDFFKYIKMENYCYKELIRTREDLKYKYNAELLRLNLKKERLWTQMDITKWELNEEVEKIDRAQLIKDKNYAFKKMCYKESNILNNLHQKLGWVNKMNMDELRRMINNHCIRFTQNIKEFVEVFYPTLTDGINVWSNLATSF